MKTGPNQGLPTILMILVAGLVLAGPREDVIMESNGNKCGWSSVGEEMQLRHTGSKRVKITVLKSRISRSPDSNPEERQHLIHPNQTMYIGCTRSKARNGPRYKYSIGQAEYNAN